jgi:hypothetical protein
MIATSPTVSTSGLFGGNRLDDVSDPLEGVRRLLQLINYFFDLDHGYYVGSTVENLGKQRAIERIGEVLDLVEPDPRAASSS